MKKVNVLAVIAGLVVLPLLASDSVSAEFKCEIGFTGPNSNNECVSEQQYTCEIENNNQITINDNTQQEAATGNAKIEDNTSGGGAVSGTAKNSSGTTYNFTVSNSGESKVCVANKVVPASETPEAPANPAPGRGESAAPVQPSQKVTPAALPVTSGTTAPVIVLTGTVVATGLLALAYRKLF